VDQVGANDLRGAGRVESLPGAETVEQLRFVQDALSEGRENDGGAGIRQGGARFLDQFLQPQRLEDVVEELAVDPFDPVGVPGLGGSLRDQAKDVFQRVAGCIGHLGFLSQGPSPQCPVEVWHPLIMVSWGVGCHPPAPVLRSRDGVYSLVAA
jgi:hypothetical protein